MSMNKIEREQRNLNEQLSSLLKKEKIENIRLTSLGNSIASGYSMVRTTKPLLLRNETIKPIMENNHIKIERYHFARAQNNCDDHIFEWLHTNIKISEIYKLNRMDYENTPITMSTHGLTEENINKYYPIDIQNDIGLQDTILQSKETLANIVVYNGCTGSFLDALTRKGTLLQQGLHSIKKDVQGLEAILKFIQSNNRYNGSNTQVYICGVPDFLGLGISEFINKRLRTTAQKYANTIYVNPIKSKFFYNPIEIPENKLKKHRKLPDIHYDEEEYLRLNNNILKAVYQNYQIINSMIYIDRRLYKISTQIENSMEKIDDNIRENMISTIINEEVSKMKDVKQKKQFLINIRKYLLKRFSYDFYYLGKYKMNKSIDKIKKNVVKI